VKRGREPSAPDDDADAVPYIAHAEFRNGAAHGRFRIVVNPKLAQPYVLRRTWINVVSMAFIGAGAVLALGQQAWTGGVLVALGIVANRVVRWQAPKIVLHLAQADAATYDEVTRLGILEVQRR
jgi:CO/xanthine dehydrogenase FAD-binding subunit